jgi:hypothetical protein
MIVGMAVFTSLVMSVPCILFGRAGGRVFWLGKVLLFTPIAFCTVVLLVDGWIRALQ